MRIIGGVHRSRRLLLPPDYETTRPITDRVKQAMFDRLTVLEAFDGAAADVFAGTGSIGLEAISRGIEHCTFIERDHDARDLLEQNIASLHVENESLVIGGDALAAAWIRQLPHLPLNLVFLDPPYALMKEPKDVSRIAALMSALAADGVTYDDAILVLRTPDDAEPPPLETLGGWSAPETHSYGSMNLHFYRGHAKA